VGGRFIPGIGWLGLDPSHGILTGNTHFPIASSAHFDNTMPVSGGIRGSATSNYFSIENRSSNNPLLIYTIRLNL
jgi:transglutaminase-like putative cysteine protease